MDRKPNLAASVKARNALSSLSQISPSQHRKLVTRTKATGKKRQKAKMRMQRGCRPSQLWTKPTWMKKTRM